MSRRLLRTNAAASVIESRTCCTLGLGRAAAQALLDDGHQVVVHPRNPARAATDGPAPRTTRSSRARRDIARRAARRAHPPHRHTAAVTRAIRLPPRARRTAPVGSTV